MVMYYLLLLLSCTITQAEGEGWEVYEMIVLSGNTSTCLSAEQHVGE